MSRRNTKPLPASALETHGGQTVYQRWEAYDQQLQELWYTLDLARRAHEACRQLHANAESKGNESVLESMLYALNHCRTALNKAKSDYDTMIDGLEKIGVPLVKPFNRPACVAMSECPISPR